MQPHCEARTLVKETLDAATLSRRHMDKTWGVGNVLLALEVDIFDIPSLQLGKCFSRGATTISRASKLPLGSNDEIAPFSQCVLEWLTTSATTSLMDLISNAV